MKLYGHPWSVNTRKSLVTAAEKGHELPLALVMLPTGEHHQPAYREIHPFAKVPALDDDGFVLYEARAIDAYLDRVLAGPALVPARARDAARMEQWIGVADAYFAPSAQPLIVELLFRRYLGGDQNQAAIAAGRSGIEAVLEVLDGALGSAPYLAGDTFSLADIYWLPYVDYLRQIGEGAPIERRANVAAWATRVIARPAWQAVARSGPQPYEANMTADVIAKRYR
jgi:glutathione S-transferase|nr:glutathione binding-like protein [Kofleriaceae bacterium]